MTNAVAASPTSPLTILKQSLVEREHRIAHLEEQLAAAEARKAPSHETLDDMIPHIILLLGNMSHGKQLAVFRILAEPFSIKVSPGPSWLDRDPAKKRKS